MLFKYELKFYDKLIKQINSGNCNCAATVLKYERNNNNGNKKKRMLQKIYFPISNNTKYKM